MVYKVETKKSKCGCLIMRDRYGILSLRYCPLHKAAPDMYEALLEARGELVELRYFPRNLRLIKQIQQAIAKAEGK